MAHLTRRGISAIAKLDFSGLSHTRRIDAIARALGYKTGEALMGSLKSGEMQHTSPETPVIEAVYVFGSMGTAEIADGEPFSGDGMISQVSFATEDEYKAYRMGLEDADGWMDHNGVIDTIEDPNHPYFRELANTPHLDFIDWWNAPYVYIQVSGTPSDPEDRDVPGVYRMMFDRSCPGDVRTLARSALDTFHENVPIATLDDFDIRISTAAGTLLEEEDAAPDARTTEFDPEDIVRMSPDDVPDGVLRAFEDHM